jgi:AhpD family alkylhydroperoxidase
MSARIESPVRTIPGFYEAALKLMGTINAAAKAAGVTDGLLHLIYLRASQINGCGLCVDMHWRDAAKAGESDERVHGVAAFREMPWFNDAERAALALVEAETRIADKGDAVPDAIWKEAERHWSAEALAVLVAATAMINTWNRMSATTRQTAGAYRR